MRALVLRSSLSLNFYSFEVAGAERDAPTTLITGDLRRAAQLAECKALPEGVKEVADGIADVFDNFAGAFHDLIHNPAGDCIDDLVAVGYPENAEGCVEA